MKVQIEKADADGATRVDVALRAPPAASAMGVPTHAPEPMNEPITAATAHTNTATFMNR